MSTPRRYSEEEIGKILDRAVEVQRSDAGALAPVDGLTLDQLMEVGAEAGISPEAVRRAATELDRPTLDLEARKTLLGFPLGVGRSVDLPRPLTDGEWERLVSDIRVTFDAQGQVLGEGRLRSWSNGNLRIAMEPAPEGTGYRLRMRTQRGNTPPMVTAGAVNLLLGLVFAVFMFTTGDWATGSSEIIGPLILMILGGALTAGGLAPLPGWAAQREAQMEAIGRRALELIEEGGAQE